MLSYRECSEATSNTFWSGAPFDFLAREYIAKLTNLGLQRLGLPLARNLTALDTVAVTAMEGTGWTSVLMMREAYRHGRPIPFVNLRAAADYTHPPVMRANRSRDGDRAWPNGDAWIDDVQFLPKEAQQAAFMAQGYHHSIRTSSSLLLHLFRQRQERMFYSTTASARA